MLFRFLKELSVYMYVEFSDLKILKLTISRDENINYNQLQNIFCRQLIELLMDMVFGFYDILS